MKTVIISDTHGKHEQVTVPECELLIHCGDWTGHDSNDEWGGFVSWILEQPAKHIVLIHGNHDNPKWVVPGEYQGKGSNLHILHDTSVILEGKKIYGSPWTPNFFDWHWMLDRNSPELKAKWDAIPDDTQILVTHGPKQGILDQTLGIQAGCELLEQRIRELDRLELHCFGHIHAAYGQTYDGKCINAAICNEHYRASNKPMEIDI